MCKESKNVSSITNTLEKEGILSKETTDILSSQEREVEIPKLSGGVYEDQVFCCFAIDSSGSMHSYKDSVIESHPIMLDTLRKSAKCRHDALYVVQYLFSDITKLLNPFEKLDKDKNDSVVVLDQNNYEPDGTTALYKTVFHLLQDMSASIEHCYNEGVKSLFTIAVITDGEDNQGGIDTSNIRTVIQDLKTKGFLLSSVVLGLANTQFSKNQLEDIKNELGFDQAISLGQNSRDIRKAFILASQSSLNAIG